MQGISGKVRFNFGLGDAVCVRDALMNFYNPHMGEHHEILSMSDMGYPGSGPGIPELVEDTRNLIENQIGKRYSHIIITAGASMGIIVALKAATGAVHPTVSFRMPYFFHYPSLAEKAGYTAIMFDESHVDVYLVDSPTNPDGKLMADRSFDSKKVLWDATYNNRVFSKLPEIYPKHDVMVGSFGKLLGLTGIRLGWIATDDEDLAFRATKINYQMTLGVSVPSQRLALNILENISVESFTKEAALQVDCNREEMSKLEYLSSDGSSVPTNGMFFWTEMDDRAKNLLERCGVSYTRGVDCGGSFEHVRLNLAQSRKLTKDMVKMVRRVDGKR